MKLPTPEEKNPRVGQLRTKRAESDSQKSKSISELALVRARLKHNAYSNTDENFVRKELGEQPLPDAASDRLREQTLLKEIHDLNVKIGGFDRAIRNETTAGSRLVLQDKAVKDALSNSGIDIKKALIHLHSAVLGHDQNLDALEDVGCDIGQYRIRLSGLGNPRDLSSGFWYAMRDLIDLGYMSKNELPKVYL